MSSFIHGAGFRIVGAVVRKFVAQSGKFAAVTIDVNVPPRSRKIECRAFDAEMIDEIGQLGAGQTIEITGQIDMEKLTDKKREPVKVDGYEKWSPALTVKAIKIEGSSVKPAAAPGSKLPPLDDDVNF